LFSVGFGLLPFVWTVNVVWFFEDAFLKPAFEEQKQIKRCKCGSNFSLSLRLHKLAIPDVTWSAIGSILWFAVLIAWVVTFQTNRTAWGELGDDLSIIIPLGSA
jgi:presenilin enhancer 2